jgi:cytochrome P450
LLSKHQDVQKKLRNEIKKNLYEDNKRIEINNENTKNIDYLNFVIKEGMRLFPPIAAIPLKKTTKEVVLGDYKLPKGTLVQVNVRLIQRDPEIFDEPELFKPDRWSEEAQSKKKIPLYSWIPFSQGPRICIGNNFSLMEQRIFLWLV